MILATANTGSIEWRALALDEDAANDALLAAYASHAVRTPYADPDLMLELIEDREVNYAELRVGEVLRDGEPVRA